MMFGKDGFGSDDGMKKMARFTFFLAISLSSQHAKSSTFSPSDRMQRLMRSAPLSQLVQLAGQRNDGTCC